MLNRLFHTMLWYCKQFYLSFCICASYETCILRISLGFSPISK